MENSEPIEHSHESDVSNRYKDGDIHTRAKALRDDLRDVSETLERIERSLHKDVPR
jgi:hypothetical protein